MKAIYLYFGMLAIILAVAIGSCKTKIDGAAEIRDIIESKYYIDMLVDTDDLTTVEKTIDKYCYDHRNNNHRIVSIYRDYADGRNYKYRVILQK